MIVSNASPLHYLVLTDTVSVLPALYERVSIPAAVREELLREATPASVREWMSRAPDWLIVHPDPTESVAGIRRDVGEARAIALALKMGASGILLDDRKARTLARREGLLVVGTLGVLEAAAERKLLDLRSALEALVGRTNFRVTSELVRSLLQRAGAEIAPREPETRVAQPEGAAAPVQAAQGNDGGE